MPLSPADFRELCPVLEHYAPRGVLRLEHGLLSASGVLNLNADAHGMVWARFLHEPAYKKFNRDHWKTRSRFQRRAGERGCNLLVRDAADPARSFFLGNNYPLGEGTCLGTTLPLTDNRPGDPQPSREDWFAILNGMFWVFDAFHVNPGFLDHLRAASPNGALSKVTLTTAALSDDFIKEKIRLSAINGGGSNGAFARGTATYKRPSEWVLRWPPKEMGVLHGLSPETCDRLSADGALNVEDV